MTGNHQLVSTVVETRRRYLGIAAGTFALATLLPAGALAMDSPPKMTADRAGYVLPLPPIRYLDSMRWMDWKPSAPVFKVDTLLFPDSGQPGVLRLPPGHDRDLARVS